MNKVLQKKTRLGHFLLVARAGFEPAIYRMKICYPRPLDERATLILSYHISN